MHRIFWNRLGVSVLALSLAGSAAAFADDDARRAILDLREEMKAVQSELTVRRNAQMKLMEQLNALQEQNRRLTGRVEELSNALSQERRSTRELFGSIDNRVAAFEPTVVRLNGKDVQVSPQEKTAYDAAVLLFQDGKFAEAARSFQRFVARYDKSPYLSEALFWWGSSAFGAEQYKTTIDTQNRLLKSYPRSDRAPDAMLLVSSAQAASGNVNAATATLEKVIRTYPKSEAAATAKERLEAFR